MRNEAAFWTVVRGAINAYPRSRAHKLTDMFTAGTPDALYCIDGVTGVLELKYVPKWPARSDTLIEVGLTENQRAWMLEWIEAGGIADVLLGVENMWYLMDVATVPPPEGPNKPPRIGREVLRHCAGADMSQLKSFLPRLLARVADGPDLCYT